MENARTRIVSPDGVRPGGPRDRDGDVATVDIGGPVAEIVALIGCIREKTA